MQIIREHQIDLVTLDLRMPEMDGVAVLKSIKAYNPRIEVMIITGHGNGVHGSAADLLRLGASGFHTKPFNPPQLINEITRTIDRRKNDRATAAVSAVPMQRRSGSLRIPSISISSLTRLRMHPTSDILIRDLCRHGIGIHSSEKFQMGEFVRVQLTFAANRREKITEGIVGEVVSTRPLHNGITATQIRFDQMALENPKLFAYIQGLDD